MADASLIDSLEGVAGYLVRGMVAPAAHTVETVASDVLRHEVDTAKADVSATTQIVTLAGERMAGDLSIVGTIARQQLKLAAEAVALEARGTPETLLAARGIVEAEVALLKEESKLVRAGVVTDTGIDAKIAGVTRDLLTTHARLDKKLALETYDATLKGPVDVVNAIRTQFGVEAKMQDENAAMLGAYRGFQLRDGEVSTVQPSVDQTAAGRGGKPEFGSNTDVFFANGINTEAPQALAEAAELAGRLHQKVGLVYVETKGVPSDVAAAYGETMNPDQGRKNPPEVSLAKQIVESLDRGRDAHVIGYSRGALVTELALENVVDTYAKRGYKPEQIGAMMMSRVTVETFNGASHHMPDGVKAEHYVSELDGLVAQTIGMGNNAPLIRSVAAHGIDGALAMINSLPTTFRERFAGDVGALVTDFVKLQRDATNPESIAGLPADVRKTVHDLQALRSDVVRAKSQTPGADEIAREGYGNQSGPVHTVPAYLDAPGISRMAGLTGLSPGPGGAAGILLTAVDQHNLPQMLPYRGEHTVNPNEVPGALPAALKAEVESKIPATGSRGTAMPPPRSIEPWDGKTQSGTTFHVEGDLYAIQTGRGDYMVLDAKDSRLSGSPLPAQNAYVSIGANGNVSVDRPQQQGIHH